LLLLLSDETPSREEEEEPSGLLTSSSSRPPYPLDAKLSTDSTSTILKDPWTQTIRSTLGCISLQILLSFTKFSDGHANEQTVADHRNYFALQIISGTTTTVK
jgi:hypothetical protein